ADRHVDPAHRGGVEPDELSAPDPVPAQQVGAAPAQLLQPRGGDDPTVGVHQQWRVRPVPRARDDDLADGPPAARTGFVAHRQPWLYLKWMPLRRQGLRTIPGEERRVMHLNVLTQCVPSPLFEGLWRHPDDRSATGYRSLGYWTDIAQRLERACVDALFFADVHGVYDSYGGSADAAVRHTVQVPAIDPVLVIPAAAAVTSHLGFAVTYSTSYHQPYQCARTFSSLDHLTGGRVGWNIVTSDLRLARG